jgi:hypothetical protein
MHRAAGKTKFPVFRHRQPFISAAVSPLQPLPSAASARHARAFLGYSLKSFLSSAAARGASAASARSAAPDKAARRSVMVVVVEFGGGNNAVVVARGR